MSQNPITIEYARQKLGKKAKNMTDQEVTKYIEFLRFLTNRVIDSVLETTQ